MNDNYSFIPAEWADCITSSAFFKSIELQKVTEFKIREGCRIFPDVQNTFRALHLTKPSDVKVVIIGQDAYHGEGQAHGLSFSVENGIKPPPSLQNIFKELNSDLGIKIPSSGNLTAWAKQGVLLLNTVLSVYEGKPNSCADWGWQDVTSEIVRACFYLPQPIVFILWGRQARVFVEDIKNGIDEMCPANKICICSSHPSPLGAYKGSKDAPAFIGSKPFSKTNDLLAQMGSEPIDWSLS